MDIRKEVGMGRFSLVIGTDEELNPWRRRRRRRRRWWWWWWRRNYT